MIIPSDSAVRPGSAGTWLADAAAGAVTPDLAPALVRRGAITRDGSALPDPATHIRLVALRALRGANYWARFPVVRMDVAVGAYDAISSAEVPGMAERLQAVLPGLVEHRCSIGERGGFLRRVGMGTYAPHIIEHVAIELQRAAGFDVGFGRARDGDRPGEYTVAIEYVHSAVGLRAAALAFEAVRRALAGGLWTVEPAIAELRAVSRTPDGDRVLPEVLCGISGWGPRAHTRCELMRRGLSPRELLVQAAPGYVLEAGLPYSRSQVAILLGGAPTGVPARYRDPGRARRLTGVAIDAVPPDGVVIVPAGATGLQEDVRAAGRRVAVFADGGPIPARVCGAAHATACVLDGRIAIETGDGPADGGVVHGNAPPAVQAAAALAAHWLGRGG